MGHICTNIPKEARWNGKSCFDKDRGWIAFEGEYWIQGQRFQVRGGEVIHPRKKPTPGVDQQTVALLDRLLANPTVFPDRVILSAMERSGTDTSVVRTRRERAFLPAGRLFTDAERMGFSGMVDFFGPDVIANYGKALCSQIENSPNN